jgi:hypothetical protein
MEIIDLTCEFCGNSFSNTYAKNRHQKTAKYCAREIEDMYICICDYKTSLKTNFSIHIKTCKPRNIINKLNTEIAENNSIIEVLQAQNVEYEDIIQTKDDIIQTKEDIIAEKSAELEIKDNIIKEKNREIFKFKQIEIQNKIIQEKDKEILKLKLLDANKGGQITVHEKRPIAQNVANYINPKLINVKCDTIRPFTIETVKEEVTKGAYTYDLFLKGAIGLAEFISNISILDDQRSYVCTDSARNKFHRLLESRSWKDDNGATFLTNIFDELRPMAELYYNKIIKMTDKVPENGEPDERDSNDALMRKMRPIFYAITHPKSKNRDEVLNKVRTEVKKLASI